MILLFRHLSFKIIIIHSPALHSIEYSPSIFAIFATMFRAFLRSMGCNHQEPFVKVSIMGNSETACSVKWNSMRVIQSEQYVETACNFCIHTHAYEPLIIITLLSSVCVCTYALYRQLLWNCLHKTWKICAVNHIVIILFIPFLFFVC